MKHLFYSILIYSLVSCGSDSSETNAEKPEQKDIVQDSTHTSKEIDTSAVIPQEIAPTIHYALTPEDVKSLKPYLKKPQITALNSVLKSFSTTSNDIDVIGAFQTLLELTDSLKNNVILYADYEAVDENGDYYPFTLQNELAGLELSVPGFINSCVAECTEYDCRFELSPFQERAKFTEGSADDEFFEALSIANGSNMTTAHQFREWFAQFWDYGGATFLGSEIHLSFLTKVKDYNSKYKVGNTILQNLVDNAFGDMQHGIYMNSPEKVAAELHKIISLEIYSPEENQTLLNLAAQIENKDYFYENCVGQKLQFNCETGDCDFGG